MAAGPWSLLVSILAHHDPDAAAGATGIRAWLGEAWVHQVSVSLHATGALLLAGGLAAVLLMRSASATDGWMSWNAQSRGRVRLAVLGGWLLNGLGGLMRLYEPDHPGLGMFSEVTWVQVMTFKHVALIGAFVFSLLAIELGPRPWTSSLRQHASVALVLVLVASLSGGVATGLVLPGMDDDATGSTDDGMAGHLGGPVVTWRNATVDFAAATPLAPRTQSFDIEAPHQTTEIWVEFTWTKEQSTFTARLLDPSGEERAVSGKTDATTAELTADGNVAVGTWTLEITSTLTADEKVRVTQRLTQNGDGIRLLEETVTVAAPDILEINLYMDPGEYFNYSWSLAPGDPAIPWDIHSHPDEQVVTHHKGRDTSGEGNFTAGPNEVYSLFWYPDPGQSVTLTYRVEGNFTVHSIYR